MPVHARNIISLLDEGNTIPFIARYRKEQHGAMDDQKLREFAERLQYMRNLDKRKNEIIDSIKSQGKLTEELRRSIEEAGTLAAAEDIYRPYKQKRRTRAALARELGLEPLAEWLLKQELHTSPLDVAKDYINNEKGLPDAESCLNGACDILAEGFSDSAALRAKLRPLLYKGSIIKSEKSGDGDIVYEHYHNFEEPANRIKNHHILAINRGEKENSLKITVNAPHEAAIAIMEEMFLLQAAASEHQDSGYMKHASVCKPGNADSCSEMVQLINRFQGLNRSPAGIYIKRAIDDSWHRLLFPSLERELRSILTERAQEQAIKIFAVNLKQLLMQPPVRGHVILAIDPAYRTGCKCAVIDATGSLLDTVIVYPTPPQSKILEASETLSKLIKKHEITVIAIGNGTASKETEIFASELIKKTPGVSYVMVNEAGASVYSASRIASDEFPKLDVSLRSAVSIARRLQDPLAELVKVDPKSIGVGQYQHDMPQSRLGDTLDGVVEDCVNNVGVDLNVASAPLLARIAGLGPVTARNIVTYREENGAFKDRKALLKVSKLGPKAFEQCAGFLRVPGSKHVLDNTSVHPESYKAAEALLGIFSLSLDDVGALPPLQELIKSRGEDAVAKTCSIGVHTLRDIAMSLQKPGRDPRDEMPPPDLRKDILDISDLKAGMKLSGTVRNVIDFGVFVDIGVHQDGLVHISQLADRYIRHPAEVVKVGDSVNVTVLEVSPEKKRISLTMKTI